MSGARPYDALLLVSFGGPEGMEDVLPFLENVLRGRNVPRERLREVADHYEHFGGVSPINAQNRALIAALRVGARRARHRACRSTGATATGTRSSPTRCGRWRGTASSGRSRSSPRRTAPTPAAGSTCEDIARARSRGRAGARRSSTSCASSTTTRASSRPTPTACARRSPRCRRLAARRRASRSPRTASRSRWRQACRLRGAAARDVRAWCGRRSPHDRWELVYQSRSGPPQQPWLEPDILDHLRRARRPRASPTWSWRPIGFVSDHMEVSTTSTPRRASAPPRSASSFVRAGTAGTHPRFVRMIRELIEERVAGGERRALGRSRPARRRLRARLLPVGRRESARALGGLPRDPCRRGPAPAVRPATLAGPLRPHRGQALGERDLEPLGLAAGRSRSPAAWRAGCESRSPARWCGGPPPRPARRG